MFLAELYEGITLEVGVCFNLINSRLHFGVGQAIPSQEDVIVAATFVQKNKRSESLR